MTDDRATPSLFPFLRCVPAPDFVTPRHVHVVSVFGNFCYLCMHRKRWWRFWETWTVEEHDEPF